MCIGGWGLEFMLSGEVSRDLGILYVILRSLDFILRLMESWGELGV